MRCKQRCGICYDCLPKLDWSVPSPVTDFADRVEPVAEPQPEPDIYWYKARVYALEQALAQILEDAKEFAKVVDE